MKKLLIATVMTAALSSTNVLAQERAGGAGAGASAAGGVDQNVVFALASTAVLFGAVAANSNGFSPTRGIEPTPTPTPTPATCIGDDQLVDGVCIGTTVTSTVTDTITGTGTATATATVSVTSLVTFTYAPTN